MRPRQSQERKKGVSMPPGFKAGRGSGSKSTKAYLLFGCVVADLGDEERFVRITGSLPVVLRMPLRDLVLELFLVRLSP